MRIVPKLMKKYKFVFCKLRRLAVEREFVPYFHDYKFLAIPLCTYTKIFYNKFISKFKLITPHIKFIAYH